MCHRIIALVTLFVIGCSSLPKDHSDTMSETSRHMAIVKGDDAFFDRAVRICPDNKPVSGLWLCRAEAELSAGSTVLYLAIGNPAGHEMMRTSLPVNLTGGRSYLAHSAYKYGRTFVWIEDESDGSLVAGERPNETRKILK